MPSDSRKYLVGLVGPDVLEAAEKEDALLCGRLCETAEVLIPSEFGAVYESYNALQSAQGFDLLPLRGQTVTRYSFAVTDYPEEAYEGTVRANVLFAGNKIVAADLCSVALDGFICGVISDQ